MTGKSVQVLISAMMVLIDEVFAWISRRKGNASGASENDVPKS